MESIFKLYCFLSIVINWIGTSKYLDRGEKLNSAISHLHPGNPHKFSVGDVTSYVELYLRVRVRRVTSSRKNRWL